MQGAIERALAEDVGAGDLTAAGVVPEDARATARILQKAPGVLSGMSVAESVFRSLDPGIEWRPEAPEGEWREGGPVVEMTGSARAIVTGERTALNFLGRLSGIATVTARYVEAVRGTGAVILDTRKTTPGLRDLEKAAVRDGGATNHRAGLHDAILVKENHATIAGGVGEATRRAIAGAPPGVVVEVECGDEAEVDEALEAGAGRILLDNMDPDRLRAAVERVAGRAELEASGGITLENVRAVAETGVDFISVGALTHSAPALDLSLIVDGS
jgi:nicotinate-nucleotide pyrophosphorylase (carboxylating)